MKAIRIFFMIFSMVLAPGIIWPASELNAELLATTKQLQMDFAALLQGGLQAIATLELQRYVQALEEQLAAFQDWLDEPAFECALLPEETVEAFAVIKIINESLKLLRQEFETRHRIKERRCALL